MTVMESPSLTALVENNLRLARWHAVRWKRRLGLNQQDFEDAEQEARLALILAARHCDPEKPFGPYAGACCDHALQRWAKKRCLETTNHALPEFAMCEADTHSVLDLLEALRRLPPTLRHVLILRYGLDGKTPHTLREVGRALNLSHSQVALMQGEAVQTLRHFLDAH